MEMNMKAKEPNLIERFLRKLEFAERSNNTIKVYRARLNELDDWLRNNYGITITTVDGIKNITGFILEEWQMWLREQGIKPVTEHAKVTPVRSFFDWAKKANIVSENPSDALIQVKIVRSEQPHLEWKQVEQLMHTYRSRDQMRDMCIFGIGFVMGLRVSGICGLNIEDFKENKLTFTNKGGARLTNYVPDFVANMIKEYIKEKRANAQPSDPLFIGVSGERLTSSGVLKLCKRAGKIIGVNNMTAHAMRRSALTRANEVRGIEMAQSLAAHSSSYTTQRYLYQSEENMKSLYNDMGLSDFETKEGVVRNESNIS